MDKQKLSVTPRKNAVVKTPGSKQGIHEDKLEPCGMCGRDIKVFNKNYCSLFGKKHFYRTVESAIHMRLNQDLLGSDKICKVCERKSNDCVTFRREVMDHLSQNSRQKRVENFTPEKDESKRTTPRGAKPKSFSFASGSNEVMQVNIQHRNEDTEKFVDVCLGYCIKDLISGNVKGVLRFICGKDNYLAEMVKIVCNEVKKECNSAVEHDSILKATSPQDIANLTSSKIVKSVAKEAPVLSTILSNAMGDTTNMKKANVLSTIFKSRNIRMSAWHHRTTMMLKHEGLSDTGLAIVSNYGGSMAPSTARYKSESFGDNFNVDILDMKTANENACKKYFLMDCIQQYTSEVSVQDFDPIHHISVANLENTFGTLNVSDITEGPLVNKTDMLLHEQAKGLHYFDQDLFDELLLDFKTKLKDGLSGATAVEEIKTLLKIQMRVKYKIIGDNIDMCIKTKHMSSDKKNQDIHWFHIIGMQLQVPGDHLPNSGPQRVLTDVPNIDFIPSMEDVVKLEGEFAQLIARCWLKSFPCMKDFVPVVPSHIPHQYTDIMKEKTKVVGLGIIPKGETSTEGMVEILRTTQDQYVPTVQIDSSTTHIVDIVDFEGDQLTEIRARHAKSACSDGDTDEERIDGLHPTNADWHAIRIAYQAAIGIFANPKSGGDFGTYWSNATICGDEDAKKPALDEYNNVRDFFQMHVEANIIAATLSFFNTDNVEEDFVPEFVQGSDHTVQQDWFFTRIHLFAKMFIFDDPKLRENIRLVNGPFACEICDKTYQLQTAYNRHMRKIHDVVHEDITIPEDDEDYNYNYGCATISVGLLLRNFHDAVHEGDGDRIVRLYKFLMLLYRAEHKTNYALAALRVQAELLALLPESKAHELKWNRTVKDFVGRGTRKSTDLKMENMNLVAKEAYRHAGMQNITEEYAIKKGKSIEPIQLIVDCMKEEAGVTITSYTTALEKNKTKVFKMVKEIHNRANIFTFQPGRSFEYFPKFKRNVLHKLDAKKMNKWITEYKGKWQRQANALPELLSLLD